MACCRADIRLGASLADDAPAFFAPLIFGVPVFVHDLPFVHPRAGQWVPRTRTWGCRGRRSRPLRAASFAGEPLLTLLYLAAEVDGDEESILVHYGILVVHVTQAVGVLDVAEDFIVVPEGATALAVLVQGLTLD